MIKYEAGRYLVIAVNGVDDFKLEIDGHLTGFHRNELLELRHIIDQALNTSAEELGDAG
jgi:hypothetical protein